MGQRERLMAAAKRCLEEKGYARTTSRDLASAADANVASINYHYGSKEELLTAALLETVDGWAEKVVGAPAPSPSDPADPPAAGERLPRVWSEMIESFATDRAMIVATVEALAQAERLPQVGAQIAAAYERARASLAGDLHGAEPWDERTARALASVHMALIAGLSLQWLVDTENAPSADDVLLGLRALLADLGPAR
ncbi:TetR/AcrR family transcriptional regulator [Actinomadura viridis]|uniref:AcrR family transcriptional regulator n=1 Tax=Actinomadura viridis TaxID=58110 RepID=A0A931DR31_9ACTN|nr:TetR/AcrR family transcriptional regulator [Actinomadura viridis]MBG6092251.1 AcrR family transcriptional regulator [Actinomadura viridis]